MLALLIQSALAFDVTTMLNPQLSMQCQLALNARMDTLQAGCLSPYDLGTFDNPPANILDALFVQSFSFLPTLCSTTCTSALQSIQDDVATVCKNEVLINPAITGPIGTELLAYIAPLIPSTTTGAGTGTGTGAAPAVTSAAALSNSNSTRSGSGKDSTSSSTGTSSSGAAQQAALATQFLTYVNTLSVQYLVNIGKAARNVICVKNAKTQDDLPNPVDNKYCVKSQLQAFESAGVPLSQIFTAFSQQLAANPTGTMCNTCIQYEVDQMIRSVQLVPLIGLFSTTLQQFNATFYKLCPTFPPVVYPVLSGEKSLTAGLMLVVGIITLGLTL
ncbi:hypothetical protein HDV06_001390 [Boothiomyces sp. JEL0866]|nr:hypothetical protein HDV06_001390 [Boothiomyces sp. JEL0866]